MSVEQIGKQTQATYEQFKKIKTLVDVGFFLIDYVVAGGEVTKDVTLNNRINVTEIVVSLDNDVTRHEAVPFITKTPHTTYFLDFQSDGMYHFDTAHYSGLYLPITEVTTDANGNVSVITDKRGEIGGFRLRPGYEYSELLEVIDARTGSDGVARDKLGTLVREIDAKSDLGVYRNAIINSNFSINQRAVSGTITLASGQYGHDRWKAGSGGCTYTFSTINNVTIITIINGSLVQVIEGTNLSSGKYTLSWSGTAQGKIGAGSYGVSGISSTVTGGENLSVEFNSGTFSKVQFNAGDMKLPFQPRSFAEELTLCQRYYEKSYDVETVPQTVTGNGCVRFRSNVSVSANTVEFIDMYNVPFVVRKRVTPTVTVYSNIGTIGAIRVRDVEDRTGVTGHNIGEHGFASLSLDNTSNTVIGIGDSIDFHWTADAEL